jgi:beta-aspartyl-peptidase (threonine type)
MAAHRDVLVLGLPAVLIHGGAGVFSAVTSDEDAEALVAALEQSTDAGWGVLAGGGSSLEAVIEAVVALEDSGRFNAGRGAVPTKDGEVELDASVMDAASGMVGAICASTYPANPVRAARAVAEVGGVPDGPVLLAGEGADRFCEEQGLARMRPEWLGGHPSADDAPPVHRGRALSSEGTVGAVAVDSAGRVAAATSTGGRAGQRRGRVGDSPIPGAGVLAVPTPKGLAVSATGAGEAFIVAGFAHRVAWAVEGGSSLEAAIEAALEAVGRLGGTGGGIAVDDRGEIVAAFTSPAMARAWRGSETRGARIFP